MPNFVFDCRAVKNPGRIDSLKILTGLDSEVIAFLDSDRSAQEFKEGLKTVVLNTFPIFLSKKYTNKMFIGFCCTGGRHRSVYFSEKIATALKTHKGVEVNVSHLDIDSNYI
jgi:RNase adaptor protein for sRNA GlmZ degradation